MNTIMNIYFLLLVYGYILCINVYEGRFVVINVDCNKSKFRLYTIIFYSKLKISEMKNIIYLIINNFELFSGFFYARIIFTKF